MGRAHDTKAIKNPTLSVKRKEIRVFDVSSDQLSRLIAAEQPIGEPRADTLPNNGAENQHE